MKLSIACGGLSDVKPDHSECDGTAFGNAADDKAFMASLPPDEDWSCGCDCHRGLVLHNSTSL